MPDEGMKLGPESVTADFIRREDNDTDTERRPE